MDYLKPFRVLIVAFTGIVLLGACATPYQQEGFTGGFTETQLAPNTFRVRFGGNGFTGSERTADFVLLRSAELALAHGYRYFGVVAEGTDVRAESITTPQSAYTTLSPDGRSATTQFIGGQTITAFKPSSRTTIVCFTENPQGTLFDATFVARSIRTKYGMPNATLSHVPDELPALEAGNKNGFPRALQASASASVEPPASGAANGADVEGGRLWRSASTGKLKTVWVRSDRVSVENEITRALKQVGASSTAELQKSGDTWTGVHREQVNCRPRPLTRRKVCPVIEFPMTITFLSRDRIEGYGEEPLNDAAFDCGKCSFIEKPQGKPFVWHRE